ncbi:MAG: o-succinylbenzoate synthase [Propionibacteriaceae bacterium]|jgi:O-succinylbenzoate synthase|nr:o-succinylbenzoate synthase [Propionibacteriaceae bacterium]
MIDPASWHVYAIDMPLRFRGITQRQGMIARGQAGWTEWSPFLDYHAPETAAWLRAAEEVAEQGYPAPLRDRIEVNVTVPATDPATAHRLVTGSRCRTAKVKVAEPGQSLADDLARVEAVRDALGPDGKIRVDANGAWSVDEGERALRQLAHYDLEYAEQPCHSVEELADVRRRLARWDVLIAADESIRRTEDPYLVKRLEAADVAVLKVQPLGGVRACLRLAEDLGLAVVVSSAIETSVGLRAGIALAAALPQLPYACGLNTAPLLAADVVTDPLLARDGWIEVRDLTVDEQALRQTSADQETTTRWRGRLVAASRAVHDRTWRCSPGAVGV